MKKIFTKHIIFTCIAFVMYASVYAQDISPVTTASGRWTDWRKQWGNQFPTASWSYFSRYSGSVEEYTTYKNAGLTMVQAPLSQYGNATTAGLRIVSGGWEKLYEDQAKLDNYIAYPGAKDPSTAAYNLMDEPGTTHFSDLGTAVNRIYQTDRRKAIPLITMLPNWAVPFSRFNMTYESFVDLFIQETNPAVMVSTHYPTLCNGTDRPEYYQNIELFRNRALANNLGLMGFVNLTPYQHDVNVDMCYRVSSESDIYWQVYSMLAYGSQGIWYYNYRIGDDPKFGAGLVLHETGEPNSQFYPYVQAVNSQLHQQAYILMKLKSIGVFHAHANPANLPAGTTQYTNGSITAITNLVGDNFLVSEFNNQDDGSDVSKYIMLVNKRHAANTASSALQASATLTIDPAYEYVYQYSPVDGSLNALTGSAGQYTVNLDGGHGTLLRISQTALPTGLPDRSLGYISPKVYQKDATIEPLVPQNNGVTISPTVVNNMVKTVSGKGNTTPGALDGPVADATFNNPANIAFDKNGNAYIADYANHTIRKITPAGTVSTFAGIADGTFGTADGGLEVARFRNPNGVAVDNDGNVYVADRNNHRIRKITSAGTVSTLTGAGTGYVDGTLSAARFAAPIDIAIDNDGVLYVAEVNGHRIRKIVLDGVGGGTVSTLAGNATGAAAGTATDGEGTAARFWQPYGVAVDKQGNVYVADQGNHKIRKITPSGTVTTLAGSGTAGVDDGEGALASFNRPAGIAVDANGEIYVADYGSNRIRKTTPSGTVTTVAGVNANFIDGLGTNSRFRSPFGMAIAPSGNLYIADYVNHAIRRLTLSGYSISPNLPKGLNFDNFSGTISGTPTEVSPATDYTITVYNGNEEIVATSVVNITVEGTTPVTLVKYEARPLKDGSAELVWQTSSERNNSHFTLSVSYDGINYHSLQQILSKGNEGGVYRYIDKYPIQGASYYKLTQHDTDGTVTYLGTKVVNITSLKTKDWSIYPNPLDGVSFKILLPEDVKNAKTIVLYDISGKVIHTQELSAINKETEVVLPSKLYPSIYIVEIKGLGAKKLIVK